MSQIQIPEDVAKLILKTARQIDPLLADQLYATGTEVQSKEELQRTAIWQKIQVYLYLVEMHGCNETTLAISTLHDHMPKDEIIELHEMTSKIIGKIEKDFRYQLIPFLFTIRSLEEFKNSSIWKQVQY